MPSPYFEADGIVIYHGDCLELLNALEATVDAVVMDPPYASGSRKEAGKPSSGAMVRGARWANRPIECDQLTTPGFIWLIRHVALQLRPLMGEGSSLLAFIDWRQWGNLVGAIETAGFRVNDMLVWDKVTLGMGNGYRNQHELICHASLGVPRVAKRDTANVLTHRREDNIDHPSPKPVGLMERLVRVVAKPGEMVIDPFMGAGSTLVAARNLGCKAIGIESNERHCETAARRLSQRVLFGGSSA